MLIHTYLVGDDFHGAEGGEIFKKKKKKKKKGINRKNLRWVFLKKKKKEI